MATIRLLDLLNFVDEAVENGDYRRTLQLILSNWDNLPDPSPLRERTALLLATVGRRREAMEIYALAARHYANSGYPTRALAAIKQMQALNPASTQLLDHFTTLYSVRSPFLKRGMIAQELPQPSHPLRVDLEQTAQDLDELFPKAIERALSTDGIAERPQSLPGLPMLSLLPPKALRRLLDLLEYEIFPEEQPVFDPTADSGELLWAVSADLHITDGDRTLRVAPGSLLGLEAFGQPLTIDSPPVISQIGSECLRLSAQAVETMTEEFPDFPNRLATLRRHALTEGIFFRHPIFKALNDEAREEIADHFIGLKLNPATVCIRQGKTSPGLYIILDGRAQVVAKGPDFEVTAQTLGPGQLFGEIGLFVPRPAPATIITSGPCHALYISRDDLLSFAQRFEAVGHHIQRQAKARQKIIDQAIAGMNALAEVNS